MKSDVAKVIGQLFGESAEKTFLDYYDDSNPAEILKACNEMMIKMIGPAATHKHCEALIKKYPELRTIAEGLE